MQEVSYHRPVMFSECIEGLNLKDNGVYVDSTLGGAGHSEGILEANPTIKLFAFDQDPDAIKFAKKRLERFGNRVVFIQDNFVNLRTALSFHKINRVDGIIFDLGVSSHQIDAAERGFSFSKDAPLDMRMDKKRKITASYVVNNYSLDNLTKIFREYGEEKSARRIANLIVEHRKENKITTSTELNDIIKTNMKMNPKFMTKTLSRIYQALRIEVNQELEVLKKVLKDALNILNPGGRLVIESYHSLEDKSVKSFFKYEALDCVCPSNFPKCICNKISTLKIITRKPITATKEELEINSRSRSAKLRIAEKKEMFERS